MSLSMPEEAFPCTLDQCWVIGDYANGWSVKVVIHETSMSQFRTQAGKELSEMQSYERALIVGRSPMNL